SERDDAPPIILLSPGTALNANHTDADAHVLARLLAELKMHSVDGGGGSVDRIHALIAAPLDKTFEITDANWIDTQQPGTGAPNTSAWQFALGQELLDDAGVLYSSPTLTASYTREHALRIFRLGWLLVALNSAT